MIWRGHPTFEPRRSLVDDDVLRAAERYAARTAIIDARSGRTLTFGQLVDGARRLAAGLAERGIGHRDVVAIAAGNGPDYAVALYGAMAAGAVVESANPALTASELTHHFGIGHPKLVFTDEQSDAAVREAFRGDVVRLDRLARCWRHRGRGPPDGGRTTLPGCSLPAARPGFRSSRSTRTPARPRSWTPSCTAASDAWSPTT